MDRRQRPTFVKGRKGIAILCFSIYLMFRFATLQDPFENKNMTILESVSILPLFHIHSLLAIKSTTQCRAVRVILKERSTATFQNDPAALEGLPLPHFPLPGTSLCLSCIYLQTAA